MFSFATSFKEHQPKGNILILVPSLSGGGQERIAVQTAEILMKKYDVTIIIFSEKNKVYNTSIKTIDIDVPSKDGFIKKAMQQIKRIIKIRKLKKKIKPQFVFSFGNTANITNVFSGGDGLKVISVRGYANIRKNIIDRLVYYKADFITCISNEMIKELNYLYPITKNKTKLLYNGIDIESIQKQLEVKDNDINLPNKKKIITAGRLTDVKGHSQLLKSFSLLKSIYNDVTLIVLGEGENKDELIKLSEKLGISDSVTFLGFKKNLYSIMKQCDVFVLSSINEGFGNVIVEAMVCELPIISTSCLSGPAEILGGGDYNISNVVYSTFGVLVPTFKSDKSEETDKENMLMEAMLDMLTNEENYEYYKKMSIIRASEFSLKKYSENLFELLNQMKQV